MPTEEDARRRKLAAVAVELGAEVARLAAASESQALALSGLATEMEKKTWKTTVKIRWMIALVTVDVILSGAMFIGYFTVSDLVKSQEVVRAQVLCPLYSIFVSSYNPNSLAAKAQGIDAYNKTFAEIQTQYGVLRCTTPPR
jgi:hypothetical protein